MTIRKWLFALASTTLVCALIAPDVKASQPIIKDRTYYEKRGDIVWEAPVSKKQIAFTFDDGPDEEETVQILELLKKYDAKATFFVVGQQSKTKGHLIRREIAEGHEVGNHTYFHTFADQIKKKEDYMKELEDTDRIIEEAGAPKPTLFRPPGGVYNDIVLESAKKRGYTIVLWSWHQDTADWSRPGKQRIINKVLRNARNGDIVLFHDNVHGQSQTVKALERILPELKKQGYQFVTVSELLKTKEKEVMELP
ncbi:polysaccharide deacetylase family protein [Paenibacillus sp. Marseille-Q4541]|uniref:polysaccharide deacetylase family protein n=1 Tax=Paenibacillus sp. Marseille-Q4541 TaxID=2831522 RepID=UPI001BAA66D8|nr:polysaccharide deacetylase family protein [Paenibacillus sp. Marseille-Q4541]